MQRLLWLAMVGVIAASFVYETSSLSGEVLCIWRRWTGLPCPSCGLTRSFCAMARLDVIEAFRMHLAGPPLYIGVAYGALAGALERIPGAPTPALSVRAPQLVSVWWWSFFALFIANIGLVLSEIREILVSTGAMR